MNTLSRCWGAWLSVGVLGLAMGGSGCLNTDDEGTAPAAASASVVPAPLLEGSWQIRMADDSARAPFEQNGGWATLFMRQHHEALAAFEASAPVNGIGLARIHIDLAALYRQAALMGANATRHVYGTDRQPEDPASIDYMVGVANAVVRDCPAAKAAFAKVPPPTDPALASALAFWQAEAEKPDCAASLTVKAAPPLPGLPTAPPGASEPNIEGLPHWTFGTDGGGIQMGEIGALVVLADWHEAAARTTAPEADLVIVDMLLSPWDLPGAPARPVQAVPAVDDGWLFGGFALSAGDVVFLAALRNDGLGAVSAHATTSILAATLAPAVADGKVDVDVVIDRAAQLRAQLMHTMAQTAGVERDFHRPFGDLALASALRAGMFAADAAGQYRDAGVLRVNALERSTGPAGDPVFFLSTAAWDAGNRSPLRAQDIVHSHLTRFPALAAARYPLDALHIRLGRNSAPATPLH